MKSDPLLSLIQVSKSLPAMMAHRRTARPPAAASPGFVLRPPVRTLRVGKGLEFHRGDAGSDACGAKIFVQFLPMHAVTAAADLKILAIGGIGFEQARIPLKRIAHYSAILQSSSQKMIRYHQRKNSSGAI